MRSVDEKVEHALYENVFKKSELSYLLAWITYWWNGAVLIGVEICGVGLFNKVEKSWAPVHILRWTARAHVMSQICHKSYFFSKKLLNCLYKRRKRGHFNGQISYRKNDFFLRRFNLCANSHSNIAWARRRGRRFGRGHIWPLAPHVMQPR